MIPGMSFPINPGLSVFLLPVLEFLKPAPKLLGIFRRMPKGGLLHVHSAAALSTDGYLELLLTYCGKDTGYLCVQRFC